MKRSLTIVGCILISINSWLSCRYLLKQIVKFFQCFVVKFVSRCFYLCADSRIRNVVTKNKIFFWKVTKLITDLINICSCDFFEIWLKSLLPQVLRLSAMVLSFVSFLIHSLFRFRSRFFLRGQFLVKSLNDKGNKALFSCCACIAYLLWWRHGRGEK